jgi:23S rRNA (cytosine1962-C5)-methyltransferase
MSKEQKLNVVVLRRGKEESLERRHPWVFSGAIERIIEGDSALAEGDVVDVLTKQGEFIARGHYQIGSIAVRVLSFEREAIDKQWWTMRIAQAKQMREAQHTHSD